MPTAGPLLSARPEYPGSASPRSGSRLLAHRPDRGVASKAAEDGGLRERGRPVPINTAVASAVIPGLAAGVIYFVIAFATGASAAASIIGGIVVAAVAVAIGVLFLAAFRRRAASPPSPPGPPD